MADDGAIHGLEDDYATFSERGERGDRDLWAAHLTNLLRHLGDSAATLVECEFLTINGDDIARINVEPSDHPVYDTKGGDEVFWWRFHERTTAIADAVERERITARRWS